MHGKCLIRTGELYSRLLFGWREVLLTLSFGFVDCLPCIRECRLERGTLVSAASVRKDLDAQDDTPCASARPALSIPERGRHYGEKRKSREQRMQRQDELVDLAARPQNLRDILSFN